MGIVVVLIGSWSTPPAVAADPPTVTIDQAASQPDPAVGGPVIFDVVFSEPVIEFDDFDTDVSGSTAGNVLHTEISGSGAVYQVKVYGMDTTGTVVASIPAGSAFDTDGLPNTASTSTDNTVTWIATPPTVTIDQAASQPDPAVGGPVIFDVVFSEPVIEFDDFDTDVSGSTAGNVLHTEISGSGAVYQVKVYGMDTTGTVVASIPAGSAFDTDGLPNTASTSTDNTVTWIATPPTVTIDQAASQPDPAVGGPVIFDVVFSEPVIEFDDFDTDVSGSTAGNVLHTEISGSGAVYQVKVYGMDTTGTVVASIPAGSAFDTDGLPNTASTSTDNTVTWEPGPPLTVTIDQAASQPDPASGDEVLFDVVFSEPVTGFDDFQIDLAGSTAGPVLFTQVIGSGAIYQVRVFGMTTDAGTIVATIPARSAFDEDGFPNEASTSTDNTVTWTPSPAYEFTGFFQPVDMVKLNTVKAGSAIPVKFTLGGDRGLSILEPGYPKVTRIGCTTSMPTDAIESTLTTGVSGLTYDTATDQYTYAWKTSKSWAGGCYRFELGLDDGSSHTFDIAFLK